MYISKRQLTFIALGLKALKRPEEHADTEAAIHYAIHMIEPVFRELAEKSGLVQIPKQLVM